MDKEEREIAQQAYNSIVADMLRYCIKCYTDKENKRLPWISADEDLPCKHEDLITDGRLPYSLLTEPVLIVTSENTIEYSFMCKRKDGTWQWAENEDVLYWLIVPDGIEEFLYGTDKTRQETSRSE